jgi:hypothetical protein
MKLPNVEQAIVPQAKITTYLLNETHPEGGGKALFFIHFGFSVAQWDIFVRALIRHAYEHEVVKTHPTRFGMRYVIEGELDTPSGRKPNVRVVWFIRMGESVPRLVTAYALEP